MSRRAWRRCRRLLLVALLTGGVALMHTMGHPGDDGGHGGATTTLHGVSAGDTMLDGLSATVDGLTGAAVDREGAPLGLDPMKVCVAVLLGGLVLLLAALAAVAGRFRSLPASWRRTPSTSPRAPPVRLLGLRLADLSVVRT